MLEKKNSPSPALGVCYYPEHWIESRWPEDLQRMHDLGIRFVRVGEFAWSRFEPEPESYDFAWLKRFLNLVNEAGLAAVVGTPTASPPKWLVDSMPDMIALVRMACRGRSVRGDTTVFRIRGIESNASKS
jgi:beta-galactosidase